MNHHETRQRELMRRRALQARHLEDKRQLRHHAENIDTERPIMSMRNWTKVNQRKLKESHGSEDVAGRRLPSDIYDLPGMRKPMLPPPSKEQLRKQAMQAWTEWNATRRTS
jgi:hypothetical protein